MTIPSRDPDDPTRDDPAPGADPDPTSDFAGATDPAPDPAHAPTRPAGQQELTPHVAQQIGPFSIIDVIGVGGMGIVYRAHQERPSRDVALKIMRSAFVDPRMLSRFGLEVEVLGRLHHPGIAQVYQAGTFEDGPRECPYFAMELVEGAPLLEHAQRNGLNLRQRCELFIRICDAVHHAHQQGVIHRDLKPGNILVEASGQPKILDFGVARATDCDIQLTTQHTDIGQVVGTIPYMSPEQVSGRPDQLDTRSDVYALGVILFELLADARPYDLEQKTLAEAARIITHDDPTRLGRIDRTLRGDVETIVGKALEKAKDRRYQSASALAADTRRFLAHQPISARPPSASYQLAKFARRNKALVGGIAAVFVVLILGLLGTTWGLIEAIDARRIAEERTEEAVAQRAEAERQAATVDAVNDFLNTDLLRMVSPEEMGREVSLREVLEAASERIEGRFPDAPLVEASVRKTLADVYSDLGDLEAQQVHLVRAIELSNAELGPTDVDTLGLRADLGRLMLSMSQFTESEAQLKDVLALSTRHHPNDHGLLADINVHLGFLYLETERQEDAEQCLREAVDRYERFAEQTGFLNVTAMDMLAILLTRQNRFDEAEPVYKRELAVSLEQNGVEHPTTLAIKGNYGQFFNHRGTAATDPETAQAYFETAESMLTEVSAANQRVLGDDHAMTLGVINNIAFARQRLGDLQGALEMREELAERFVDMFGENHHRTAVAVNNLGQLYRELDRVEEALEQFTRVVEIRRAVFGENHVQTMFARAYLGDVLNQLERFAEAEPVLGALVETSKVGLPEGHWYSGDFRMRYGIALRGQSKFDEAERQMIDGYEILAAAPNTPRSRVVQCATEIADLYDRWGRPEESSHWKDIASTPPVADPPTVSDTAG